LIKYPYGTTTPPNGEKEELVEKEE